MDQTDFATYGTHGVAAFTAYQTDLNTAGSTDNVSIDTPTILTADSNTNSLRLGFSGTLDLGGNTLNLASGGLIQLPFDTTIDNGTLTAGADSAGELVIHNDNAILDITADITDNGTEAVGLTFAGGKLFLRGNNTYSGPNATNLSHKSAPQSALRLVGAT